VIPLRDSETLLSRPVVTHVLIALNVAVFLYELTLGPELEGFVRTWGFIPARYFWLTPLDPEEWVARYLPILGSMFLHGGWAHLIGNMVYLWIFGDNVEDRLGHGRYLVFYVVCGVSASLAQAYLHPDSLVATVGASGAISGVLGAYLVLFPYARALREYYRKLVEIARREESLTRSHSIEEAAARARDKRRRSQALNATASRSGSQG
jgi:membrane associated rhomboid family serine protease